MKETLAVDLKALKKCDIVMKGGITSGIVYPSMVSVLAERYQFQSIGGTSAGAIAATVTAAAEYARRGGTDVFGEVAKIPAWLGAKAAGGDSNLFHLFQPQPGMKGLFRFATGFLLGGPLRALLIWCQVFWLEILVGLLPGAALLYLAASATGWRFGLAVALGLLVAVAGVVVTAIVGLVARAARLPSHHYGLCTGYTDRRGGGPVSLIAWLDERLNTLAGMPQGRPLTFGDLRGAGITLKMITTCLTYGRPFTMPFESPGLYYSPAEMARFFPATVVQWMKDHPATISSHGEAVAVGELMPLPDCDDLPVVFAARLSLSFPVLFCAVPLYAVDWTRRRRDAGEPAPAKRVPGDAIGPKGEEDRQPERVWFSDGGICSNFPMHLFDSPLPRWPTFGINLRKLRPDRTARVWMPTSNRAGIAYLWTRLGTQPGLSAAGGLFAAIFDAAQNWLDNLQTFVPGFRDRIVHVYLDPREGGLNLNMPPEVVTALSDYGRQAAQKLIEHFVEGKEDGETTPMTWDNHRWIRYRSTMALLETFLTDFSQSIDHPEPGDRTYADLIQRHQDDPPDSYRLTLEQRAAAPELTDQVHELGDQMSDRVMEGGAPKPTPALRIRPAF
jgi:hypothetical protein